MEDDDEDSVEEDKHEEGNGISACPPWLTSVSSVSTMEYWCRVDDLVPHNKII